MNTPQISLSPAHPEDIPAIRNIAEIAFRDTYKNILSPEQMEYMMEWMYSADSVKEQMTSLGHKYILLNYGNECVGYTSYRRDRIEDSRAIGRIEKIYLLPSYQRLGLGKVLINAAENGIADEYPEFASVTAELNVNRNNKAVGFYKHQGYNAILTGDFPIGCGYYMNDYIMAKTVKG